jgi:hypothetical protein
VQTARTWLGCRLLLGTQGCTVVGAFTKTTSNAEDFHLLSHLTTDLPSNDHPYLHKAAGVTALIALSRMSHAFAEALRIVPNANQHSTSLKHVSFQIHKPSADELKA